MEPNYKFRDRGEGYNFLNKLGFKLEGFSVVPNESNMHVAVLWEDGGMNFVQSFDDSVVKYQDKIRKALNLQVQLR